MNPHELRGVQPPPQRRERFPDQMPRAAGVNARVVIVSLDPVDVACIDHARPGRRRHDEHRASPLAHAFPNASHGGRKPRGDERLDEIIERLRLERPHGKRVVRGNENDDRHPFRAAYPDHLERVELRHLHVEKHEIGRFLFQSRQRLTTVAALADDDHVRLAREQLPNAATRQRLVVDDERANFTHGRARDMADAPSPPRRRLAAMPGRVAHGCRATSPAGRECSIARRQRSEPS